MVLTISWSESTLKTSAISPHRARVESGIAGDPLEYE